MSWVEVRRETERSCEQALAESLGPNGGVGGSASPALGAFLRSPGSPPEPRPDCSPCPAAGAPEGRWLTRHFASVITRIGGAGALPRCSRQEVSPDPPERGQDLTITVEGVADASVEDGAYADVTVKAGVIKLLQKEFDICEEARNANTTIQCPVEKGTHKVVQTVTLPKEIPPAQFKVNIRGFTEDDDDLVCMDLMMDFRIRRGSFLPW